MYCQSLAAGAVLRRAGGGHRAPLFKFVKELINLLLVVSGEGGHVLADVLTLVSVALVANLLIIIFAGYESLVSEIDADDIDDVSVRVETNLK